MASLRDTLSCHYSPAWASKSICVWFCWCTWRWDQFVFYIRYL